MMQFFNKPIFALLTLMGFVWLSYHSMHPEPAYTPKQVSALRDLQDHYMGYRPKHEGAEVHLYHKMTQKEINVAINYLYGESK